MAAETTNSKDFREKLSSYFDIAKEKPVAVTRGKDRFVLMSESEYLDLQDEVLALQRNLLSLLSNNSNKEIVVDSEQFFSDIFNKSNLKGNKKKGA
jgi:PHD/YefM family antitoxin component YafN of YafNO toxin-antitoxin module